MTKQHLWADRLKAVLPPVGTHNTLSILQEKTHPTRTSVKDWSSDEQRPGHVKSRKIRRVCRGCNSGWMRILEEQAIPLALPLINGNANVLSTEDQKILSLWIAMNVATAEYLVEKSVTISSPQRQQLMSGQIPDNFTICIAPYVGGHWGVKLRCHSMTLLREYLPAGGRSQLGPLNVERPVIKNTQIATMGAGCLIMQALSCPLTEVTKVYRTKTREFGGIQIWPSLGAIDWFPVPALNDERAQLLADWLDLWLSNPGPIFQPGSDSL